jgi:hypothetical protein
MFYTTLWSRGICDVTDMVVFETSLTLGTPFWTYWYQRSSLYPSDYHLAPTRPDTNLLSQWSIGVNPISKERSLVVAGKVEVHKIS